MVFTSSRFSKKFGFPSMAFPGILLVSICVAALVGCNGKPEPGASAPNILIISMDTTRADHVGCYGYQEIKTPNIDGLARDGVLFEQAYSVQPVTLPAHTSIMTGKYPFHHGVRDNNIYRLADSHTTLAEILTRQGYLTTAFIASYILNHKFGLDQGFRYYNDRFVIPKQKGKLPVDRRASEISFLAQDWLNAVEDERGEHPFFLWLHYYDPHADYDPPQPYRSAYSNKYDGEIAYTDDWIGFFFDSLKEKNLWDNTLIILVGDHGESFGEYGEQTHGIFIYKPTIHVPLIIRYPGVLPAGQRIPQRVSVVDIMPTILDLLQIHETSLDIDGDSLLPLIQKTGKTSGRVLYSEAFIPRSFNWSEVKGIRQDDYLFIEAPRPELYRIGLEGQAEENIIDSEPERGKVMRETLLNMLTGENRTVEEHVPIDDSMVAQLQALGYFVGGGASGEESDSGSDLPDPKDRVHLFNRYQKASSLIANGIFEAGAKILEGIIKDDPDNPRYLMELADVHLKLEDFPRAEKHLKHCLEIQPDDSRTHYLMGVCYEKWNREDDALNSFSRTIELNHGHYLAYFHTGLIAINREDWQTAEKAFKSALRLHKNDSTSLNNLGYIAIRGLGNYDRGIRWIEQALELDPENPSLLFSLGTASQHVGDLVKAELYLKQALDIIPDNPDYIRELKSVYREMGNDAAWQVLNERQIILTP